MKRKLSAAALLAAAAMLAFAASAGAVDGTIEINQAKVLANGGFPYNISNPGSYRLTGNLSVTTPGADAIDVHAHNVTIDLNGFSVTSVGGSGINASSVTGTTVENGTVGSNPLAGIAVGTYSIVRNVHADSNYVGIQVGGAYAVIQGCTANNGYDGIQLNAAGSVVSGSTVNANANDGINAGGAASALIIGNTITNNGADGINGGGASVGYRENLFLGNGLITGGAATSMGNNLCNGTVC
jgi:hypothetical protein